MLQTSLLTCFGSPGVQAAFASIIALLTLGIQRELSPYLQSQRVLDGADNGVFALDHSMASPTSRTPR